MSQREKATLSVERQGRLDQSVSRAWLSLRKHSERLAGQRTGRPI